MRIKKSQSRILRVSGDSPGPPEGGESKRQACLDCGMCLGFPTVSPLRCRKRARLVLKQQPDRRTRGYRSKCGPSESLMRVCPQTEARTLWSETNRGCAWSQHADVVYAAAGFL